jgi:UPF0716 protein FxsA
MTKVGFPVFLLLLGLPFLEIAVFILVGGAIGVLPTLALVLLAAVAGMAVIRSQGVRALGRLQASLETGGDPSGPLAHGALIVVAGVLLIVPGFLTDATGLLLLVPGVRRWLIHQGASRATVRAASYVRSRGPGPREPLDTIDAEYEVVDEGAGQRRGSSGWTRPQ